MTVQRLHSAFAPIDVLTRLDLEAMQHQWLEEAMRTKLRGLDAMRLPRVIGNGNGTTIQLFANANEAAAGPEQGDIWMVRRVIVKSSSLLDSAKYTLFKGSTPSDIVNSYGSLQLLDGQVVSPPVGASPIFTTQVAPAVPASTVAAQNNTNQNYSVVISAGTLTQVSVNGIVVGTADGTYIVPPGGFISITYTVAPTWTWTATQTSPYFTGSTVPGSSFTLGQNVNIGYYPGTKAVLLQPGEQIYAQLTGTILGAQYLLEGEGIRVPAEMKGKVLGG